ncbi:nuclear transport factor 2 family protein [Mucilaginibacter antarcticus]|uniref:Nuclear transport factor 2 family protein n=1 Tax=Mucilaginibacter antarcticus TaxID=1855725 RepID=A0ABW5XUJ6_9SPHI
MKKLIGLIFIFCFTVSISLFAQSPDEKAIASQVEAMRKAMISGDRQGLSDVLSERVSYGHSFDFAQNKAQLLDGFVSGKFAFTKIDIKDQKINVEGNTAIVRHKFIADTNDNGKTNSVALGVLQVWKRYQGKWLLYARQGYRLPNAPK